MPLGLVVNSGSTNLAMKTNELKKNPYSTTFNISTDDNVMMGLFDQPKKPILNKLNEDQRYLILMRPQNKKSPKK